MKETFNKAYEQALRFLEPRFLSSYELKNKLINKDYNSDVIEAVLKRLVELDYINDYRLSEQVLNHFMRDKKYGVAYIRMKMKKRGLEPSENILSYDEYDAARTFLLKKYPVEKGPYNKVQLMRKLYNRGFSNETIYSVYESVYGDV